MKSSWLFGVLALAVTGTAMAQPSPQPPAGPRGRPFVTALFGAPLVTFAGPVGPLGSETISPADRFAIAQLIGGGYVVNPRFRFGAIGIFNEALTGLPPQAGVWQLGGIVPIAIGTFDRFVIGGGPIIGYRSGGKYQRDAGAVVLAGASIPLRNGSRPQYRHSCFCCIHAPPDRVCHRRCRRGKGVLTCT